MGPLSGLRIIDMTSVLMGPYATQTLGDFGADVIKIESPDGDLVRQIGPARHPGMGPMYLNVNRSKRSVTIDLKQEKGRDALLKLCEGADVLVYNIRAKAMARLGLSYEAVKSINPKIIYAGLFGYGQNGPYCDKPAYDDLIQGGATLPHLFAKVNNGEPRYVPAAIADRVVGLTAVGAILASVLEAQKSGVGQRVDIPMFETMVGFILGDHLGGLTYDPPLDHGGYVRQLSPSRRPYRTRDGYVCALIYNDGHWHRFLRELGQEDLMEKDERFSTFPARMANINFVNDTLAEIFLERTAAEWLELLESADCPAMPMHDFDSVLEDPHLTAVDFFHMTDHPTEGRIRSMRHPVVWSRTPAEPDRLAPNQGEHTVDILLEAGFDSQEIEQLIGDGVVGSGDGQTAA